MCGAYLPVVGLPWVFYNTCICTFVDKCQLSVDRKVEIYAQQGNDVTMLDVLEC